MSLWLKLTNYDGTPCRMNMDLVEKYETSEAENDKHYTYLNVGESLYQVLETVEDIDNALLNDASPLRLKKNSIGWT